MKNEVRKASFVRKIHIFVSVLVLISIATSPAGSAVSETFSPEDALGEEQGEVMDVEVMVNPDRNVNCLKTMELGDLKIAVLGSEELDVAQIQQESAALSCEKSVEAVQPTAFEYKDITADGYTDLVMIFDCHEAIVKLDLQNCFCKEAPLKITASLDDSGAKTIEGSDTTLILPSFR